MIIVYIENMNTMLMQILGDLYDFQNISNRKWMWKYIMPTVSRSAGPKSKAEQA